LCVSRCFKQLFVFQNFEWRRGYTQRFGVHYIDFKDPNLTRIPKASANALKKIYADNGFIDTRPPIKDDAATSQVMIGTVVILSFVSFMVQFFWN
jgi:hypothetical protein